MNLGDQEARRDDKLPLLDLLGLPVVAVASSAILREEPTVEAVDFDVSRLLVHTRQIVGAPSAVSQGPLILSWVTSSSWR